MSGPPPERPPLPSESRMLARDASLADRLRQEPYRFEFFQAVRMLERIYPDRTRWAVMASPTARSSGSRHTSR